MNQIESSISTGMAHLPGEIWRVSVCVVNVRWPNLIPWTSDSVCLPKCLFLSGCRIRSVRVSQNYIREELTQPELHSEWVIRRLLQPTTVPLPEKSVLAHEVLKLLGIDLCHSWSTFRNDKWVSLVHVSRWCVVSCYGDVAPTCGNLSTIHFLLRRECVCLCASSCCVRLQWLCAMLFWVAFLSFHSVFFHNIPLLCLSLMP